jgi:hypothetical protein
LRLCSAVAANDFRPDALPRLVGRIGRRSTMIHRKTYGAAALALGLAISTLATPSFAQRSEDQMSGSRQNALRDCNAKAGKLTQHSWADHQIQVYRSCMSDQGQQE